MKEQRETYEQISCNNVKIKDNFWGKKMELIYEKVLPYQWEALNDRIANAAPSYCIANFKLAVDITEGRKDREQAENTFQGFVFQDSDVAKWLEAAAFSLTWHQDKKLEQTIDEVIDLICRAQQKDGYLDTYYIINGLEKRFTNLTDNHELYCLGHMLEAACSYYHATGKRKLLDAMIRYVELVDATFGAEEGKIKGYPGHEVVEMALVKLYEITKEDSHLQLAKYFIDQRGQSPNYFEEEAKQNKNEFYWKDSVFQYGYYQAHKPVREQETAIGHAVRAVYLYSGMADVARLTKDKSLIKACDRIWNNIYQKQMYITGAIGASSYGESFTFDYDLPNDSVYGETCASIGLIFFAMRMLKIRPDSQYADGMERALYNTVISGISLDGTKFFYVNPLEILPEAIEKDQGLRHVKGERQKWFGCACCPPNIARILASLGSYIYTTDYNTIWQHLYIGNETAIQVQTKPIILKTSTSYPWQDKVVLEVYAKEGGSFTYACRIPGWCQSYMIRINKEEAEYTIKDGYAYLTKFLSDGDKVEIQFDMPVQFIKSNPNVRQNVGKTAVMRGPIVYCLEEEDNGKGLASIHLGEQRKTTLTYKEKLLDGITVITMNGYKEHQKEELYYIESQIKKGEKELIFIPYYAWANRKSGEMIVWVND